MAQRKMSLNELSEKVGVSLSNLSILKTGKARAAIRKHWEDNSHDEEKKVKTYNTTLWLSLPDQPGKLGEVTTLIGLNQVNISNVEMTEKTQEYIIIKFIYFLSC